MAQLNPTLTRGFVFADWLMTKGRPWGIDPVLMATCHAPCVHGVLRYDVDML